MRTAPTSVLGSVGFAHTQLPIASSGVTSRATAKVPPPNCASNSLSWKCRRSRSATCCRRRSPLYRPNESLITLSFSTSMTAMALRTRGCVSASRAARSARRRANASQAPYEHRVRFENHAFPKLSPRGKVEVLLLLVLYLHRVHARRTATAVPSMETLPSESPASFVAVTFSNCRSLQTE